jgi:threonine 3-dehydrogenase
MSDTMYALVKTEAGPGLSLERIPIPETGPNDVKIKIRKTAICGTDCHIYNWDEWAQRVIKVPLNAGHEYVGEIVEVGSMVDNFDIGDIVSGEGHIVCGKCRNCRAGKRVLCKDTLGVGVNRAGSFAEYLVIPSANAVQVLPGIPEEIAAIFDPLGNAVHTALQFDLVGEDVLITGAGPIGIMAAAIARHCGARHIAITDFNQYRLELAKKVEPTVHIIDLSKDTVRGIMPELDMREGFDVGLEMSGSSSALNSMIDNMINGGRISLLGFLPADTQIDWNRVILGSMTLKGIYGREMFETWYKMMAMIQSGLDLTPIITHRLDFRQYEEGFKAMNSGRSGKVILDWTTA